MDAAIVIAGSLLNVLGSSHYIYNTLKGVTKPNRITFMLWAIAPLIGTAAALSSGVTWATVPVLTSGLCPLAIFFASFINPQSYWKLRAFDYWCGGISLLALALWFVTSDPILAIAFAIVSDALASAPTLLKAFRHPHTETASGFAAAAVSNASSFLVMKSWNFVNVAFPLYLVVVCGALTFAVLRGRIRAR